MEFIRNWDMSDAHDLAVAINDKNVQDNLRDGIPFPYTEMDAAEFISSVLSAPSGSQYSWAIQENGRAIGCVAIIRGSNIHFRTGELGYYIAQPYWSRGIVSSAVAEACRYVFENTDIIRIFAEPFSYNLASCRVLEKTGFTFEGILRNNAFKNGKVIDMKMYSLLKAAH